MLFAQVGNPIVSPPPAPGPSTTVNNVTNVYPAPPPEAVIDTERNAAPAILEGGFESLDRDAANRVSGFLNVGGQFSAIRRAIILQPRVLEMNQTAQRVVLLTLGLALAALALWGVIGTMFGSDGKEAMEAIGHVPLWAILALSSIAWYGLLLEFFERLVTLLSSTAVLTLGIPLQPGCPPIGPCETILTVGALGLFGLFLAFLYLLAVLYFAFQMWINTAFLALAGAVAPLFVFSKVTPWTGHFGDNWFRMVPGTCGDLVAMTVVLVLGGPTLDQFTHLEPFEQIALRLALLLCLGMVRQLFGLHHGAAGGRLLSTMFLARALRGARSGAASAGGAGTAAAASASAASASATAPTRAPRWTTSGFGTGTVGSTIAVTNKLRP